MRYSEIKPTQLNEIGMSPANLKNLAKGIDAQVGLEFEMIVPGVSLSIEEEENDYSVDEPCDTFSELRRFFTRNYANSTETVNRVIGQLKDDYSVWINGIVDQKWSNRRFKRKYISDYVDDQGIELIDEDELHQQLQEENPELDPSSQEFAHLYKQELDAAKQRELDSIMDEGEANSTYTSAFDQFVTETKEEHDSGDFFREHNYRTYQDIEYNFDLSWPEQTTGISEKEVRRQLSDLADDFKDYVHTAVKIGTEYRSVPRGNYYIIEPDSSIDVNDESQEAGLEFISPPMTLPEMLQDIKQIKEFASSRGCYTNESTGLHMNVSVPKLKNSTDASLDYVKLILLVGDEHILERFDRLSNNYCKSAMQKIQSKLQSGVKLEQTKEILNQMKNHLNHFASRFLQGISTQKYTSINVKDKYIEFRSPGNNWLEQDLDLIQNTLTRFVVALDAACDPGLYRQEYLKKLYKLLTVGNDNRDSVKYFADYLAGKIPKDSLKKFIRQININRAAERNTNIEKKYTWEITTPNAFEGDPILYKVTAATKKLALEIAAEVYKITEKEIIRIQAVDLEKS